jgi:DNA-binding CsgD family transcriptional regulator
MMISLDDEKVYAYLIRQYKLTVSQAKVAVMVTGGGTHKEVASRLCVAEATVKFHLTAVYRALGLRQGRANGGGRERLYARMREIREIVGRIQTGDPELPLGELVYLNRQQAAGSRQRTAEDDGASSAPVVLEKGAK